MSWPCPFRGVQREVHSRFMALSDWKCEIKFVCDNRIKVSAVWNSNWHYRKLTGGGSDRTSKTFVVCLAETGFPAHFTSFLLLLSTAAPPTCWDMPWHHMIKKLSPNLSASGGNVCSQSWNKSFVLTNTLCLLSKVVILHREQLLVLADLSLCSVCRAWEGNGSQ